MFLRITTAKAGFAVFPHREIRRNEIPEIRAPKSGTGTNRNPEENRNPGQARIDDLLSEVAFVGGCAVGLLITDEAAPAIRPTRDVDVIVEIGSYQEYDAPGVAGHGLEDEDRAVAPCRSHFSGTSMGNRERRAWGVPLKRDLHWPLKLACRFLEAYLPASGW